VLFLLFSFSTALELQPGKLYTQTPAAELHITQACLDASAKAVTRNVVHLIINGNTFTICSLRLEKVEQCPLQLVIDKDQEISFAITGQVQQTHDVKTPIFDLLFVLLCVSSLPFI
jgi:hypothetical protein